jgi:hypothetical protein
MRNHKMIGVCFLSCCKSIVLNNKLKKQIFFGFFFRKYQPKFVLLKQAPKSEFRNVL